MRNLSVAAFIVTLAVNASAAQSGLVRILLPLYAAQPIPGAYGSLWQSQFAMHNGSVTKAYTITTCPPNQDVCLADLTEDERLQPGETQVGLPPRYPLPANAVAGALLYLLPDAPLDEAQPVTFQLRVADLSRSATAAGTQIPVVREHDFHTSSIHLLNVPTDNRFRLALRVFEMNLDHAKFALRIFDQVTNGLLAARPITTTLIGRPGGFTPAFTEINDLLSQVASPPTNIRIEIEPLTAGVTSWAYVSITNNESQQITLVTPQ